MHQFFSKTLWTIKLSEKNFFVRFVLNLLRIIILTFSNFLKNKCILRASALTFYTLLSVVPVAALAFAISKGFGLELYLQKWLETVFSDQTIAAEKIISFARKTLEGARGGVIAGVGAAALFYTTIRLLVQIESSFNDIWGVSAGRSILRRLSDYLALIILFPLVVILGGSVSSFAIGYMTLFMKDIVVLSPEGCSAVMMIGYLFPFVLAIFIFTALFQFIPNTKVNFSAALLGALVTSLLFFVVQKAYFSLQFIVAQYNAVYGGFAALPLFLLWLQISWTIILLGAETSFAVQNVSSYECDPVDMDPPPARIVLCILRIARLCSIHFHQGAAPLSDLEISTKLSFPILLTRCCIRKLCEAGILVQVVNLDGQFAYQVAMPVERITPVFICRSLLGLGHDSKEYDPLEEQMNQLWNAAAQSPSNAPLYRVRLK